MRLLRHVPFRYWSRRAEENHENPQCGKSDTKNPGSRRCETAVTIICTPRSANKPIKEEQQINNINSSSYIISLSSCCSHFGAQNIRETLCFTSVSYFYTQSAGNQPVARPLPTYSDVY
jgi:hypothetical protein